MRDNESPWYSHYMRRRRLGSQGPEISVVGFGGWEAGDSWGSAPPEEDVVDAMLAGFDAGMSWIDTAESYGRSEQLIGRALAARPGILVFTKVSLPQPFHPKAIRRACEGSLRRLNRSTIDLYQLHGPTLDVPIEDAWGAMAALVDEGLVRFIGLSNCGQELVERCERVHHVDSLQMQLSLVWRRGRADLFPFCASIGTGVLVYGTLAFGILTGAIDEDHAFEPSDWRSGSERGGRQLLYQAMFAPGARSRNLEVVRQVAPIAARLGLSLPELAIAWAIHQHGVSGAMVGTCSASHARANARAAAISLSEDDRAAIDMALVEALRTNG